MIETAYLVAYRTAFDGWWHDVAGCDRLDACQEIAENGAKAHANRQYAVFRNRPRWWMRQPEHVCGLTDAELYRHTFGCKMPSDRAC